MAYNQYYPATYYNPYMMQNPYQNAQNATVTQNTPQQAQTPAQTANAQQGANNGLVWVQGMEGAKAHFVPAGATVMLMDSEGDRFYLKSSDMSGMPLPLRVFEYKEVTQSGAVPPVAAVDTSDFVTHKEFDELRRSVDALTAKKAPKAKGDADNG
jgi:hypothetical protein